MHSPKDVQRDLWRDFLRMGREAGLPVVIGTREADKDTISLLKEARGKAGAPLWGCPLFFGRLFPGKAGAGPRP